MLNKTNHRRMHILVSFHLHEVYIKFRNRQTLMYFYMLNTVLFVNFLMFILYWSIIDKLVSNIQLSDSVIHILIPVSILFQILFPFRLLQTIEQSSLCYTLGPCWLSIFNIAVCTKYIYKL